MLGGDDYEDECNAAPGVTGYKACSRWPGCGCGSSSEPEHEPVRSQGEVYYYEPVVRPQLQPIELNCIKIIHATEKAVLLLIEFNDAQVELWFPKSVVKLNGNKATVQGWFFSKALCNN